MSDLNRCTILGRVGADAELRNTNGGNSVLSFRVATTEKWKDQSGQTQERTEWHSCVMWGKRADALSRYITKGKQLYVEGKLQTRSWEDKDGNKRYKTEINVSEVQLLGGGNEQRSSAQPSTPAADPQDAFVNEHDTGFPF